MKRHETNRIQRVSQRKVDKHLVAIIKPRTNHKLVKIDNIYARHLCKVQPLSICQGRSSVRSRIEQVKLTQKIKLNKNSRYLMHTMPPLAILPCFSAQTATNSTQNHSKAVAKCKWTGGTLMCMNIQSMINFCKTRF